MAVSTLDFWKLVAQSRLLATPQIKALAAEFSKASNSPAVSDGKSLAEWLVGKGVLSRYQAAVLLAGRSGPFFFGDYKINERIAQGRLTGFFRGLHLPTGHPVMLQFLTGQRVTQPERWDAARASIQGSIIFNSARVQRVFDLVELPKCKFVVLEDIRGKSAEERLAAGRFPAAEAARIGWVVAQGLADMHQAGRTHGDLRPANILLEPIPRQPAHVKLLHEPQYSLEPLDFDQVEEADRVKLLVDYLAPELAVRGRTPNSLTDLYALGCTLYALLAGAPPFNQGEVREKLGQHAGKSMPPLEPFGVPPLLGRTVAALLAKNPTKRLSSAASVVEQLAVFVEPAAIAASAPPLPATLPRFEEQMRQRRPARATSGEAAAAPPREPAEAVAGGAPPPAAAVPAAVPAAAGGVPAPISVAATVRAGLSASELLRRRAAAQQKTLVLAVLGAALAIAVGLGGGGYWLWRAKALAGGSAAASGDGGAASLASAAAAAPTPVVARPERTEEDPADRRAAATGKSARIEFVVDDGKTLWASPTTGEPVSFRGVPPGGALFLIVRPADMLASEEGERVVTALGPALASAREVVEAASGVKLADVEQLIVTWHDAAEGPPRVSFVVKTEQPLELDALLDRWGKPAAVQENAQTYYSGPQWSYYVSPAEEDAGKFTIASAQDIKEVAAAAGAAPLMHRDIERLRRAGDSQRHVTLLFYPECLQNGGGKRYLAAAGAPVVPALSWLFGEDVLAASLSLHCDEEFYAELRALPSLDRDPARLADELTERLKAVPPAIEGYVDGLDPPQYWSRLARRYPLMIGQLAQQLRIGMENQQAIANSVLPLAAAHNLVLGGELLVSTGGSARVVAAAAPAAASPKTMEDALQLKTTYSFDQQSLEFAMRDLAEDVKGKLPGAPFEFAIKILGDDLKLDGITRNQSIRGFQQENQTVADILTALVRKANPVTTVKDPSEVDQKLVWVIGPDPEAAGKQVILITTRAAATTKKYNLPAAFVLKGVPKGK